MTAAATQRQVLVASIDVVQRLRPLRDDIIAPLAESMGAQGLIHPIAITYPNGRASPFLVAGASRLEAAKRLKWETILCSVVPFTNADSVKLIEIDENLVRGDLTPAERAIHIDTRKRIYETLHPETKHGGAPGKNGGGKKAKDLKLSSFAEDTATKTGRSKPDVTRDATRAKHIPQIANCIGTSLDQGEELDALAKLPEDQQGELITRAANGENVSAKHAAKASARAQREAELAEATRIASTQLGSTLYGVIYADPPWRFKPYAEETGSDRCADNHYPTMTIDHIAEIEIPAAPNCVLFMWVTIPMLEIGIKLLQRWGFAYKSAGAWVKPQIGTGYWFRNQLELLLVATRGDVPAPAMGEQPPQVLTIDRTEHSAKPDAFAEMIAAMFPNVPKLEMFARTKRVGWDSWGNQAA
jgi:N6-adenosine-specific RNA methylase IME4